MAGEWEIGTFTRNEWSKKEGKKKKKSLWERIGALEHFPAVRAEVCL